MDYQELLAYANEQARLLSQDIKTQTYLTHHETDKTKLGEIYEGISSLKGKVEIWKEISSLLEESISEFN